MPLILPDQLIDQEVLNQERIFTMTLDEARHQDIRPIKIAIVNLMPKKRGNGTPAPPDAVQLCPSNGH